MKTSMGCSGSTSIFRLAAVCLGCALTWSAYAIPFTFSTGDPDGLIATASRPSSAGKIEIESADDFVLAQNTRIDSVTFTGLLPAGFSIAQVRVEIYRVFPLDSTNPPSGHVLTRVNSPSDVALAERDSATIGDLSFTTKILNSSFSVVNSVLNGINKFPNQFTGGEGPVTGEEVLFTINLSDPLTLSPDHYFFVPQVLLSNGDFLWLSAPRPIVAPGTPFAPGTTDLQSWIRNQSLDPDWSRIGTDITHQGPFNAAFSLSGQVIPEPATLALLGVGLFGLGWGRRRSLKH